MMKKLISLAVAISFALPLCFADKINIPDGKGNYKTIEGDVIDLVDLNNDGYLDIKVCVPADLYADVYNDYILYVYNPAKKTFVEGGCFSNISIGNDGTISSSSYANRAGTIGCRTEWKWNGKEFAVSSTEDWIEPGPHGISADADKYYHCTSYDTNGNKVKDTYYKEVNGKKTECSKSEFEKIEKALGW